VSELGGDTRVCRRRTPRIRITSYSMSTSSLRPADSDGTVSLPAVAFNLPRPLNELSGGVSIWATISSTYSREARNNSCQPEIEEIGINIQGEVFRALSTTQRGQRPILRRGERYPERGILQRSRLTMSRVD
jgi:hypothetical protein